MADFNISWNLFGGYNTFVEWDAAEERRCVSGDSSPHHHALKPFNTDLLVDYPLND